MKNEIKLGDKAKDLVSGFVGIVDSRIECLNGCIRYSLAEIKIKGQKNEFRSVEIDSQVVEKIDDGLNKVKKIKKTKTGGKSIMGSYLNPKNNENCRD